MSDYQYLASKMSSILAEENADANDAVSVRQPKDQFPRLFRQLSRMEKRENDAFTHIDSRLDLTSRAIYDIRSIIDRLNITNDTDVKRDRDEETPTESFHTTINEGRWHFIIDSLVRIESKTDELLLHQKTLNDDVVIVKSTLIDTMKDIDSLSSSVMALQSVQKHMLELEENRDEDARLFKRDDLKHPGQIFGSSKDGFGAPIAGSFLSLLADGLGAVLLAILPDAVRSLARQGILGRDATELALQSLIGAPGVVRGLTAPFRWFGNLLHLGGGAAEVGAEAAVKSPGLLTRSLSGIFKAIPFVGAAFAFMSAFTRIEKSDWLGAINDVVIGLLDLTGAGSVLSLVLTLGGVLRDASGGGPDLGINSSIENMGDKFFSFVKATPILSGILEVFQGMFNILTGGAVFEGAGAIWHGIKRIGIDTAKFVELTALPSLTDIGERILNAIKAERHFRALVKIGSGLTMLAEGNWMDGSRLFVAGLSTFTGDVNNLIKWLEGAPEAFHRGESNAENSTSSGNPVDHFMGFLNREAVKGAQGLGFNPYDSGQTPAERSRVPAPHSHVPLTSGLHHPMHENEHAREALHYFLSQGWTPVQAAAIVGNLQRESHPWLDPHAVNPYSGAYGIAQWLTKSRIAEFERVFNKNLTDSTFEEQLEFVQYELTGGYLHGDAGKRLARETTPQGASYVVNRYYEGSDDTTEDREQIRLDNTERLLNDTTNFVKPREPSVPTIEIGQTPPHITTTAPHTAASNLPSPKVVAASMLPISGGGTLSKGVDWIINNTSIPHVSFRPSNDRNRPIRHQEMTALNTGTIGFDNFGILGGVLGFAAGLNDEYDVPLESSTNFPTLRTGLTAGYNSRSLGGNFSFNKPREDRQPRIGFNTGGPRDHKFDGSFDADMSPTDFTHFHYFTDTSSFSKRHLSYDDHILKRIQSLKIAPNTFLTDEGLMHDFSGVTPKTVLTTQAQFAKDKSVKLDENGQKMIMDTLEQGKIIEKKIDSLPEKLNPFRLIPPSPHHPREEDVKTKEEKAAPVALNIFPMAKGNQTRTTTSGDPGIDFVPSPSDSRALDHMGEYFYFDVRPDENGMFRH